MKVTFPHLGNAHIAITALLSGLDLEVVVPPPITARTIELGVKYAPESACLPFKINIGNYIEAIENGADTIIMPGGWGPCRFGYFAQLEREILNDLGLNFNMLILEVPDFNLRPLLKQIKTTLNNSISWFDIIKQLRFTWHKLMQVEAIEKEYEFYLPRALYKRQADNIYQSALNSMSLAVSKSEIEKAYADSKAAFASIKLIPEEPLKIGLVGEVYIMLEPSCNCNIIKKLGYMNVEVSRTVFASDWVNDHILNGWAKRSNYKQILELASPYLASFVGGHGQETIGTAVDLSNAGYKGLIQVAPLTCMPEIVAHSILKKVSEAEDFIYMTIYFDEQSGEAGIQTRLEAFVDMLRRTNAGYKTQRLG